MRKLVSIFDPGPCEDILISKQSNMSTLNLRSALGEHSEKLGYKIPRRGAGKICRVIDNTAADCMTMVVFACFYRAAWNADAV